MIYYVLAVILFAILIILSAIAVRRPYKPERGRKVSDDELTQRVKDLAIDLRTTKSVGDVPYARKYLAKLSRAYRVIGAKEKQGEEIYGFEKWLYENYHAVSIQAKSMNFKGFSVLPHKNGVARVLTFARFVTQACGGEVTRERIMRCVEIFHCYTPLQYREICALEVSFRFALLEQIALCADRCLEIAAMKKRARMDSVPVERYCVHDSYLYFMNYFGKPLEIKDFRKISEINVKNAEMSFLTTLTQENDMISQSVVAFRTIGESLSSSVLTQLSPLSPILEQDSVYRMMDDQSKHVYLHALAKLGKLFGASEQSVLQAALELSEQLDVHFGCILFDYRYALKIKLHGKTPKLLGKPTAKSDQILYVCGIVALDLLISALCVLICTSLWARILTGICMPFAAFFPAQYLLTRLIDALLPERAMPRMNYQTLPDQARTLVVVSHYLSNASQTREALERLRAMQAVNGEKGVQFCILADLPSSKEAESGKDGEILELLQASAEECRTRDICLLVRKRVSDGKKYVARERKRGAVEDLCKALRSGDYGAFRYCSSQPQTPEFVMLLDADNDLTVGAVRKTVNTMLHPLNRKYELLSFDSRYKLSSIKTPYASRFADAGGVESYGQNQNFYFKLCGQGLFCGKGIFRLNAYLDKIADRLPEGRVLSHDLLEGAMLSTGSAGVTTYEDCPQNFVSDCERSNRWTRGDLLLLGFCKPSYCPRLINRFVIVANFLATIRPIACLIPILALLVRFDRGVLLAAIVANALVTLSEIGFILLSDHTARPRYLLERLARALIEFAGRIVLLPYFAVNSVVLWVRTAFKVLFRPDTLLEWKTFYASQSSGGFAKHAAMILPSVIVAAGYAAVFMPRIAPAIAAGVFVIGINLLYFTGIGRRKKKKLTAEKIADFHALASDTYGYFSSVSQSEGLIPDNLQIDPAVGKAEITSPTNLGFGLISHVCAHKLGLIDTDGAIKAVERDLARNESIVKWNGLPFNWYRCADASPVAPAFVSSVDCGNWIACLIVVKSFCERLERPDLAGRLRALIDGADLTKLYDADKKQFYIGVETERGEKQGHYDLFASEARTLVYLGALRMRSDVCWQALSRAMVSLRGNTLVSWSGTAFEYLMPQLFLKDVPHSMLTTSVCRAVDVMASRRCANLWGISESGYYRFDEHMRYQYKAFGISALAARSERDRCVIAPYAGIMAAMYRPRRAYRNFQKQVQVGLRGKLGMYESVDFTDGKHVVVSHMTHHQGMILCALTNVLAGDYIKELFFADDAVTGGQLLLEERRECGRHRKAGKTDFVCPSRRRNCSEQRFDASDCQVLPINALSNGHYSVCCDTSGGGFSAYGRALINRFRPDRLQSYGAFVYLKENGEVYAPTYAPLWKEKDECEAIFSQETTVYRNRKRDCELQICVLPNADGEIRRLIVRNDTERERDITGVYYAPLALCELSEDQAHPAFSDLFVETRYDEQVHALIAKRKPRGRHGGMLCALVTLGAQSIEPQSNIVNVIGRCRTAQNPIILEDEPSYAEAVGDVLYPCLGVRIRFTVPPHTKREIVFTTLAAREETELFEMIERANASEFAQYAFEGVRSGIRNKTKQYLDDEQTAECARRLAGALVYGSYDDEQLEKMAAETAPLPFGLTRERKILLLDYRGEDPLLRTITRAAVYCNLTGIVCDLVILYDEKDYYNHFVRRRLGEICGIGDLDVLPFVKPIAKGNLTSEQEQTIRKFAFLQNKEIVQVSPEEEPERWEESNDTTFAPQKLPALRMSGCGGFDDKGDYWTTSRPKMCYSNVIGGAKGGFVVTEHGGGFVFGKNSYSDKLTLWQNQPITDFPAEMIYVTEKGKKVRVNRLHEGGFVRHSIGTTTFGCGYDELQIRLDECVLREGTAKLWKISVLNTSSRARRIGVCAALRPMLGAVEFPTQIFTRPTRANGLEFVNAINGKKMYFYSAQGTEERGKIDYGSYGLSCALLCAPGEKRSAYFQLSEEPIEEYMLDHGEIEREIALQGQDWTKIAPIRLTSEDEDLNLLVNGWLPYQVRSSRLNGRCGYYQAGGAIGFRDQLQDCLTALYYDPKFVRNHILESAGHQYIEGDVMHWWHPPRFGVRTQISDDKLFLPYLTCQYVKVTGDREILDVPVDFLTGAPLAEGEEARLEHAKVAMAPMPLSEHLKRAIDNAMRFGRHGLLLIGSGDWNDALNDIGMRGIGESVWLTMFAVKVLEEYLALLEPQDRGRYQTLIRKLREAAAKCLKDGYYMRAYTDEGIWLGSASSDVCKIDLLCQSWATIARIGTESERIRAIEHAKRLVDEENGIIALLSPPFDRSHYCGYISGYPKGVRENGGQYTHASVWYLAACAQAGMAEYANRLLDMLNPIKRCRDPQKCERYQGEPYVLPADIYTNADNYGKAGWTWYTGSASWLYHTIIQDMIGMRIENGMLLFERPKLRGWETMRLEYRFEDTIYRLSFAYGEEACIRYGGVNYKGDLSIPLKPSRGVMEYTVVFAKE